MLPSAEGEGNAGRIVCLHAIRTRIIAFWHGTRLPYLVPGDTAHSAGQDDLNPFTVQMTTLKSDLMEAVEKLDERYAELKAAARGRLGTLYHEADYPTSLCGWFDVSWDFPSIELPTERAVNQAIFANQFLRPVSNV